MSEPAPGSERLRPVSPASAGVSERDADESRVEGAHVLASEAKDALGRHGFTDEQILEWAEAFLAEEEAGDVEAFVSWIEQRQEGN